MNKLLPSCLLTVGVLVSSCASTTVERFEMPNNSLAEKKAKGIRYYESTPYILVYANQGTYKSELIYLPDTSTITSAHPWNLFAKNDVTMAFDMGVLTESTNTMDTTAVPVAAIKAAKTIAEGIVKGGAPPSAEDTASTKTGAVKLEPIEVPKLSSEKESPKIYLFKLVLDEEAQTPILIHGEEKYELNWHSAH